MTVSRSPTRSPRPSSTVIRGSLAVLLAASPSACDRGAPASPPAMRPVASPVGPATPDDAPRPVYPSGPVSMDANALTLCRALHAVPARRRAACCARPTPPADALGAACARHLSFALADGAVTLEPGALSACIAAMESEPPGGGCATQGRFPPVPPAVCGEVVVGRRTAGATCRSDLECEGSMHCRGAGPTTTGVCAGPNQIGLGCGAGVDALEAATGLPGVDARHPECDGLCVQRRCAFLTPLGGACTAHAACGPGRACVDGACTDAPGGLGAGAACPGQGCAEGLRCVAGTCRVPSPTGAPCALDAECTGACLKPDAAAPKGTCGPFCPPPTPP
jgi:hypothetical protein